MDSILLELDELKSSHGKKKKKLFVKLNHERFNSGVKQFFNGMILLTGKKDLAFRKILKFKL